MCTYETNPTRWSTHSPHPKPSICHHSPTPSSQSRETPISFLVPQVSLHLLVIFFGGVHPEHMEVPRPGIKPCLSSHLSPYSNNIISLTHWATGELHTFYRFISVGSYRLCWFFVQLLYQHNYFELYPCPSMDQYFIPFLLLSNIPFYGYGTICLSITLKTIIWFYFNQSIN